MVMWKFEKKGYHSYSHCILAICKIMSNLTSGWVRNRGVLGPGSSQPLTSKQEHACMNIYIFQNQRETKNVKYTLGIRQS